MADRAANPRGCAAFASVAHQLALRIAHFGPGGLARLVGHDRAFAGKAIVDRTTSTIGDSGSKARRTSHKAHGTANRRTLEANTLS